MQYMGGVLSDNELPDNTGIAIEYDILPYKNYNLMVLFLLCLYLAAFIKISHIQQIDNQEYSGANLLIVLCV